MTIPFYIGADVIDVSLVLRGVVCNIEALQIEVDFVITPKIALRFNKETSGPIINTGVYTRQGCMLYFNKERIACSSQTLLLFDAFNALATKVARIQSLLNLKQPHINNP